MPTVVLAVNKMDLVGHDEGVFRAIEADFAGLAATLGLAAPLAVRAAGPVRGGRGGKDLIPVLRDTGLTMLVWSVAVAAALALAS